MKANPICKDCGTELNDENWSPSYRKNRNYICKGCNSERARLWRKTNQDIGCESERKRLWRKANPDKQRAIFTRANRKRGKRPYNENKECGMYLGVHVAERVLSYVFKNVKRMPIGNPGYDFICNQGKKIDVKSSCLQKDSRWSFQIKRNTTADYFLCISFNNREELTPLHAWLIPGNKLSHLKNASISPSTVSRWDAYKLDISKIITCCDTISGVG